MIRILIYIALVFAIAAGFAWLADRPGEIAMVWQGYEVHTSLMVGAVALAALFVAIAFVLWLIVTVFRAPGLFGDWMSGRRRDRGYRALSRGMIAIGAGDVKRAKRFAVESRKILKDEPLTLLLAAQSAQLTGDAVAARQAFESMVEVPETRLLGLRGLFVEAQRAGEHEAAHHYAKEAAAAAPSLAWAGTALFEYQAAAGDWQGALLTLGANLHAKLVDRGQAHRLRAVLLTARGLDLEAAEPDDAKAVALEAVKLAPGLVPAATLASRVLIRGGDMKRASKILEAAWKIEPHPELAEAYAEIRTGDTALDRLKRAEKLAALRPLHPESQLALARAAIDAREWAEARRHLASIREEDRTERFCLLMAEIEQGAAGDRGRAREWLGRAVRSPRDSVWMADGYAFPAWAPISPISGRIDAFEWRRPTVALPDEYRPALELDAEPAGEETDHGDTLSLTIDATPAPAPTPPPAPAAAKVEMKPAVATAPERSATVALADLPPPPDDPGVEDIAPVPIDRLRLQ
ncbi:heme biosynthesis protein HemY [Kaistia dalseonensis]|uniref:HemY protein n=1 Tax=Kaistia dalseonensis TaxID=410840 RepID=A0ABU0H4R2_9HYPH|nr:heme biosynthesis HemY N-terminal domain-containing protein [Kaistia dalseonensis]MCX5494717.1 heme biosynthesis protein HemY [Kaistia dalseonensis]MDQ0437298.1 HemY protein [Kaistia dalseonensis]